MGLRSLGAGDLHFPKFLKGILAFSTLWVTWGAGNLHVSRVLGGLGQGPELETWIFPGFGGQVKRSAMIWREGPQPPRAFGGRNLRPGQL